MNIRRLLAYNLRRLRTDRGMTQDALALESGLEQSIVGHIERENRNPTIETVAKLAMSLSAEPMELFRPVEADAKPVPNLKGGRPKGKRGE